MTSAEHTPPPGWDEVYWVGRPADYLPEANPVTIGEDRPTLTLALRPPSYLRREFDVDTVPDDARLTVTALGVYQVYLNGQRLGDEVLAPGWTDYDTRVHVQAFEVADLLRPGPNVLAAVVADGWYCGFVGFDRGRQARLWGDLPRLGAVLSSGNGTRLAVTDQHWRWSTGRYVYADLQMGEMQDGRLEPTGWSEPGFDDSSWLEVAAEPVGGERLLHPSEAPAMRVTQEIRPLSITRRDDGAQVVDFGQNVVGVVRLDVTDAVPGGRIHLRHSEALTDDGDVYLDNLRAALAHDIYVCAGGRERFEPQFTFHGFRFVEIRGYPGTLDAGDISALVIHSDVEVLGSFECGVPEIDRLHENIDWTIRGNLLDVPTDCPQRDERLGWLGDAQLIMPTASFLRDLDGFLGKWAQDIRDAQSPEGAFPDVAPRASLHVDGAPGWADAGALIPWTAYLHFGDLRRLEASYRSTVRWIDHLLDANPTLVRTERLNRSYGDWLNLDDPTPKHLLASAYLVYDLEVAHHTATALGRTEDAARFMELWHAARDAFAEQFVDADGTVLGGTQTGYAMALHLDLVPTELRQSSAQHLVKHIQTVGHLTTGIHGTRFLAPALSDTGYSTVAYDLLLKTEYPSWRYTVRNGATTIWERWDGWTPHAGFQNPSMNSFNHYALGSIGEWLHRYAAGLTPTRTGVAYRHTVVRPHPDARLGRASARRRTATGEVEVSWALADDRLDLTVLVPEGATASVFVPTSDNQVEPSDGPPSAPDGAWNRVEVGTGTHRFSSYLDQHWRPDPRLSPDRLNA